MTDAVKTQSQHICELYAQGHTMKQVAEMIGKSRDFVQATLHRSGSTIRGRHLVPMPHLSRDVLAELYGQGLSIRTIAEKLSVSYSSVRVNMTQYGICRRTLSEANRLSVGKLEHHVFTAELVSEARSLRAAGTSWAELEKRYPFAAPMTVRRAVLGISWKHVPMFCSNESAAEAAE